MALTKVIGDGTGTLNSVTFGDSHSIGNQTTSDNLQIKSSSGENIVYDSLNGAHIFYKNGTENFRVNDDGEVRVTDNILLTASSKGIYLGVTSATASNLLDDYEEGTFTPDVKNQSSSSTFSVRIGNYVKIGRLVLAHFYCDGGNTGTAGSNLVISGLPFTVDAGSGAVLIGNFASNGSGENNGGIHQNSGVIDGGSNITTQKSYFSANLIYRTS